MSGSFINFRTIPNLRVTDTTQSTSSTNGSAIFSGGAGFGGNINVLSADSTIAVFESSTAAAPVIRIKGTDRSVDLRAQVNALSVNAFWTSLNGSGTTNEAFNLYSASNVTNYGSLGVNSSGDIILYQYVNGKKLLLTGGDVVASNPITSTQYKLSALNTAPASATATGTLGEIRIDANFIYVCTATDTWKRVGLSSW